MHDSFVQDLTSETSSRSVQKVISDIYDKYNQYTVVSFKNQDDQFKYQIFHVGICALEKRLLGIHKPVRQQVPDLGRAFRQAERIFKGVFIQMRINGRFSTTDSVTCQYTELFSKQFVCQKGPCMQICDHFVMDLNENFFTSVQPETNDYSNDYDVHHRGSLSGEHLAHMQPAEFLQGENRPPTVYAVRVSKSNFQFNGNATVDLGYTSGNMPSSQTSATPGCITPERRSHQTCRLRDRFQVHAQCEEDLIRENLRLEEQRNFRLRQFFQCGCCLIRRKQLLLLPCEHLTCTDCPRDSDTCPICREPILRKQRVFFA